MHRLKRAPRLAVVVGLVLAIAAGAIAYAATEPAIQTITPTSEKQITNLDVLRQQIRNYYGDTPATGTFAPHSNYASESSGANRSAKAGTSAAARLSVMAPSTKICRPA